MRSFHATILVLSLFAGKTWASESDWLCLYLGSTANEAMKKDQERAADPSKSLDSKLKELMELTAFIQKLNPDVKDAVSKRLTFEQFQANMQSKNVHVTPYYKALYLDRYIRMYCGSATDESSFTIKGGKVTDSSRKVTFPNQFDPTNHPYYDQMKQSGAAQ